MSPYAYADNQPTVLTDPSGLTPVPGDDNGNGHVDSLGEGLKIFGNGFLQGLKMPFEFLGDAQDAFTGANGGAGAFVDKYLPVRPAYRLYRAEYMLRQQGCDALADLYAEAADELTQQLAVTGLGGLTGWRRNVYEAETSIMRSGGLGPNRGKLDVSAKAFNDAEGRIAELLLSEGKNVKALKESNVDGVRTADSEVNGVPTEFKSLIPGAAANTVKNQLNSAKGQARHAIIDARASGLSESAAQEGLGKFLRNNPPRTDGLHPHSRRRLRHHLPLRDLNRDLPPQHLHPPRSPCGCPRRGRGAGLWWETAAHRERARGLHPEPERRNA